MFWTLDALWLVNIVALVLVGLVVGGALVEVRGRDVARDGGGLDGFPLVVGSMEDAVRKPNGLAEATAGTDVLVPWLVLSPFVCLRYGFRGAAPVLAGVIVLLELLVEMVVVVVSAFVGTTEAALP